MSGSTWSSIRSTSSLALIGITAMKSRHISRLEKSVIAGSLCVLITMVFDA